MAATGAPAGKCDDRGMPSRRDLLLMSSALALAPLARAQEAAYRRAAFEARTLAEVLAALGLPAPQASGELAIEGPELYENGAVVPLSLACRAPGVQRLLLGIENNPTWLAAIFEPGAAVIPRFATRVKMQETSKVLALAVLADGRVLMASREVKVTLGGCGGAAEDVPEKGGPSLIRLQPAPDGTTTVRTLMKHQMENGRRKDASGQLLPAWYIQQVVVRLRDQPVLSAQWGTSISKNPFLQFSLKGARPGDQLSIAWADNKGAKRSDEATLQEPA